MIKVIIKKSELQELTGSADQILALLHEKGIDSKQPYYVGEDYYSSSGDVFVFGEPLQAEMQV